MPRCHFHRAWILVGLLAPIGRAAPPEAVVAWPAGPLEVRVAFARQFDGEAAHALAGRVIPFHLSGNDGVASRSAPLGALRIAGARLVDDGRTLVLATDPHPREAVYLLPLPGGDRPYDLNGVEVAWDNGEEGATPEWSGWWPVVDSIEAHRATIGSVEHARGFALLQKPGRLTLRTLVSLPKGRTMLRLDANGAIEATLGNDDPTRSIKTPEGGSRVEWDHDGTGGAVELSIRLTTGAKGQPASLASSYRTGSEATGRPLAHAALSLAWAPPPLPAPAPPAPLPFALKGGDRARGEAVFFGEEAKCSACHKVRGKGGDVGPDLSALAGRDPAEIFREIADPSAVIKPDFLPYNVALKDGQVAVGVVRAEGADAIKVLDNGGKATVLPRSAVEELRPSGTSIMPVGLAGALGEEKMRDLLTFLLAPPK